MPSRLSIPHPPGFSLLSMDATGALRNLREAEVLGFLFWKMPRESRPPEMPVRSMQ